MKSALNEPELEMIGNFCNLWGDWKSLAKISSYFPSYFTSALFKVQEHHVWTGDSLEMDSSISSFK